MVLEAQHLVKRVYPAYHLDATDPEKVSRLDCRETEKELGIPFNHLKFERTPPLATVTLDRPSVKNRIDAAMAEEIRLVCREIGEDESLALVVLSGSGEVFSVGTSTLGEDEPAGKGIAASEWMDCHRVAGAVASLPVPVLVALNGDALDHGLELALAGDLRIACEGARLGLTGVPRGELPWDGGTQRLPRLVGPGWARDLILTGRTIVAAQALAIGLVNQVEPKDSLAAAVDETAGRIMAGGPIAARYAKEAVKKGLDMTLAQGLGLEADLNVILQSTGDRAEAIQSFIERRPPRFSGS